MVNKKKNSQQPHLLLHNLISALSFWGSTVRFLLFGFMATVTLLVSLSEANAVASQEVGLYIYALATFLVFDVGLVMLGRGLPLRSAADRSLIAVGDIVLALLYILPYFALVSPKFAAAIIWAPLAVFGLLSLRALIGLLYTKAS